MVFCVDTEHAEDMRAALAAENADLVQQDPEWVVRIVGSEPERVRLLEAFSDPESDTPVVATTSKLLSTGVDVPDLKLVVLFRPVGSMVEFKQIIGRGSRLYPDKGKRSFEIVDYVGATRHFADPAFDGYPLHVVREEVDESWRKPTTRRTASRSTRATAPGSPSTAMAQWRRPPRPSNRRTHQRATHDGMPERAASCTSTKASSRSSRSRCTCPTRPRAGSG
jgi:type I restriction enzyme R subunit